MTDGPFIIDWPTSRLPRVGPVPADAWTLAPGRPWQRFEMGDDCTRALPGVTFEDHEGQPHPVLLLGGGSPGEHQDWHEAQRIIARHWSRVVPWATLWAAPSWSGGAGFWGYAWGREGVAVVSSAAAGTAALETAFHEAWHLLETWLPRGELARMDAALARGPRYSWQWGPAGRRDDYLGLPSERRARFFAHWAMMCIESGGSIPDLPVPTPAPWCHAERAWRGELGGMAMEERERAARIGAEGPDPARQGRGG